MDRSALIEGRFYWVKPAFDVDTDVEWEAVEQPARYAGKRADGTLLWNYLAIDGDSDWPTIWIGEEIGAPPATTGDEALKIVADCGPRVDYIAAPMTEDEQIAMACDHELDQIGMEVWHLERESGESSDSYRKRIQARKAEFREWLQVKYANDAVNTNR